MSVKNFPCMLSTLEDDPPFPFDLASGDLILVTQSYEGLPPIASPQLGKGTGTGTASTTGQPDIGASCGQDPQPRTITNLQGNPPS